MVRGRTGQRLPGEVPAAVGARGGGARTFSPARAPVGLEGGRREA